MKIPPKYIELEKLTNEMCKAARKMTMKYGIIVHAMREINTETKVIIRLYFQIEGYEHEFDSLDDLKTALKNKAFL